MSYKRHATFAVFGFLMMAVSVQVGAQQDQEPEPMGFFITSVGPGNGADLGGLEGADAHCQSLAEVVGAGDRTWRAYLLYLDDPLAPDLFGDACGVGVGLWVEYNLNGA